VCERAARTRMLTVLAMPANGARGERTDAGAWGEKGTARVSWTVRAGRPGRRPGPGSVERSVAPIVTRR
jgi:hypothetical protein